MRAERVAAWCGARAGFAGAQGSFADNVFCGRHSLCPLPPPLSLSALPSSPCSLPSAALPPPCLRACPCCSDLPALPLPPALCPALLFVPLPALCPPPLPSALCHLPSAICSAALCPAPRAEMLVAFFALCCVAVVSAHKDASDNNNTSNQPITASAPFTWAAPISGVVPQTPTGWPYKPTTYCFNATWCSFANISSVELPPNIFTAKTINFFVMGQYIGEGQVPGVGGGQALVYFSLGDSRKIFAQVNTSTPHPNTNPPSIQSSQITLGFTLRRDIHYEVNTTSLQLGGGCFQPAQYIAPGVGFSTIAPVIFMGTAFF